MEKCRRAMTADDAASAGRDLPGYPPHAVVGAALSRPQYSTGSRDGAGHAVPTAPPSTELGADDLDHLDAGLAQQRVRRGVAVVGDDDARLDGNQVVAAVPLLTFGVVHVAAGVDRPQLGTERRLDDLQERAGLDR